jgi:hypothetical protein
MLKLFKLTAGYDIIPDIARLDDDSAKYVLFPFESKDAL